MKTIKVSILLISAMLLGALFQSGASAQTTSEKEPTYKPNWDSLSQWKVPQWFDDTVLGIYFHWGVYSVPGYRFNDGAEQVDSGLWYGTFMYVPNDADENNYGVFDFHSQTYGDPAKFGYHDLIPLFKAEKWDPDRWAKIFKDAGADFAGVAVEHCDGFAMWDTEFDKYNVMDMGPRRDVTGEMLEAARKLDMKTVVTFHETPADMFDNGREYCPEGVGPNNPELKELYETDDNSVKHKKLLEVVDKYQPDQIWFEDKFSGEENWKDFIAYYYNAAEKWGKEVFISQKHMEAPLASSVLDIEGGIFPDGIWEWAGMTEPQEQRWQKDVPIGKYWVWAEGVGCRPVNMLVDGIVDRASKNGATLLDVAPKPDGTLPEAQLDGLKELGKWMAVNKEALYAAKPASFVEGGVDEWKSGSIRFLEKGDYLYAIDLGNIWPTSFGFADYKESTPPTAPYIIPGAKPLEGSEIKMLGSDKNLPWHLEGDDLVIEEMPETLPGGYAWTFKIKILDNNQ